MRPSSGGAAAGLVAGSLLRERWRLKQQKPGSVSGFFARTFSSDLDEAARRIREVNSRESPSHLLTGR
jgi:hypothetical protein